MGARLRYAPEAWEGSICSIFVVSLSETQCWFSRSSPALDHSIKMKEFFDHWLKGSPAPG